MHTDIPFLKQIKYRQKIDEINIAANEHEQFYEMRDTPSNTNKKTHTHTTTTQIFFSLVFTI